MGEGVWSMSAARWTRAVWVDASWVELEERVADVEEWELEGVNDGSGGEQ